MTEEIVTYETAKLLKECGFPQDICRNPLWRDNTNIPSAPTQALAMRWLREEKGQIVNVEFTINTYQYLYDVVSMDGKIFEEQYGESWFPFKTYEQAAEEGIKDACEYLINKSHAKED